MLLTISTTHQPATDLGFLLAKNPSKVQAFELPFGEAHVFYPEVSTERCTAALMLAIDPISLVRGGKDSRSEGTSDQYVNDRPYVASSFMSVAINKVFGSALAGRCRDKPELTDLPIALEATISAVESPGGEVLLRKLFEPLGYDVEIQGHPLDEKFPEWGASKYFSIKLSKTCTLKEILTHIYVLVPCLDNDKHYYVGEDEVLKLLRHGEGWVASHPESKYITHRYLKNRQSLTKIAMDRLSEGVSEPDITEEGPVGEEVAIEKTISLNEKRMTAVLAAVLKENTRRVLDVGCGEGNLLKLLLQESRFTEITGMDVSHRVLEAASERLHLEKLSERQRQRINLIQGSLTYRDKRLEGYDAATCIEVIEHMDADRLPAFERVLFECAKPNIVVLTTPNSEYNSKFPTLAAGKFRHRDHRFEWTRKEFQSWANGVCERFSYKVEFDNIGDVDENLGAPTQMAIFRK
jgi:3' terminal RNA ribose 2'-O-methyltransferase Hen1